MNSGFVNRRKNYFINKKFQAEFILKFCALVILGTIISGVIIYAMSSSTVTTTFENSRLKIKSTAEFILPAVLLSGAVVIAAIGVAAIFVTLFTSHRIAGPLFRLEKDISEMAKGNMRVKINLRKTDEIKALAESLNDMVSNIASDIGQAKKPLEKCESETDMKKIKELAKKSLEILDKYKI